MINAMVGRYSRFLVTNITSEAKVVSNMLECEVLASEIEVTIN